jgi:hypothetical protein
LCDHGCTALLCVSGRGNGVGCLFSRPAPPTPHPTPAFGFPTVQYQWRRGSEDIPGATSEELVIPSVDLHHEGVYSCRVYNQCVGHARFWACGDHRMGVPGVVLLPRVCTILFSTRRSLAPSTFTLHYIRLLSIPFHVTAFPCPPRTHPGLVTRPRAPFGYPCGGSPPPSLPSPSLSAPWRARTLCCLAKVSRGPGGD